MRSAGYSGTPLPAKLGIKPGQRVALLLAPRDLVLDLPPDVRLHRTLRGQAAYDVVLLFTARAADLTRRFEGTAQRLKPAGMLWVAWPKKASGLQRDLGEAGVRAHGLACGLVDTKICAISETWSGLRFVVRRRDRPGRGRAP